MPPRLPPPPQVSKSGTPNPSRSESSTPMPEAEGWLVGDLATAGEVPPPVTASSEASGPRPPSEASAARNVGLPVTGEAAKKPARSATAALVGIGDDLIASSASLDADELHAAASGEKPLFGSSETSGARKSAKEPDVFDELGLAKTPVITGGTEKDMEVGVAKSDVVPGGTMVAPAQSGTKKTDEGFPVPPPRRVEAKTTEPSRPVESARPAAAATSMSSGRPLSRWAPHLLLGALGLASVIAIGFRCSGSGTTVAQADPGKPGVGQVDKTRGATGKYDPADGGGDGEGAGGGDAVEGGGQAGGGAAQNESAEGGAAGEEPAEKEGDAAAEGGAADEPAAEGAAAKDEAAGEQAAAQDAAAKDDAQPTEQAAAQPADSSKRTDSSSSSRTNDATPASTSSKSSSSKDRTDTLQTGSSAPPPDANLTAEELLELAKKAWREGNARDAYKYANKSRYKKPSTEATELATLAACKLHLEKSAKASFDGLEGDKRRKVRQKCREWGVWVGL